MHQYIPVRSSSRKDCEALHKIYRKAKNAIGKGSFGEVYEACIRATNDCGYVLKIITYEHKKFTKSGGKSLERYYRDWYNETSVFRELNKCQDTYGIVFSPILYDRWYCNKGSKVHFYILMERYDGDLSHLLPDLIQRNVFIAMALERMDSYLSIIHHTCKICLNDIKLQNILYKKIGENGYQLVFADFGIASQYSDEECIKIDRENFRALKDQFTL